MLAELIVAMRKWRVVHLIGVSTLRARYARSYLGQFWLCLSSLVQILVIGFVWSLIWRQPVDAFLPYYGVGFIVYSLVSTTIGESSSVIIGDARYYQNDKTPFMVSILAHVYRNILVFLHNIPVIAALLVWSDSAFLAPTPALIPAVALTLLFTVFTSYAVALLCARYRDIIQVVAMLLQNLFLLTPVMWQADLLPAGMRGYVFLNPFAAILETVRNPLIGLPVADAAYYCLAAWSVAVLPASALAHRRLGRRLIFWI